MIRITVEDTKIIHTTMGIQGPPGVGGAGVFTGLSDTQGSYAGHGGKAVRVNSGATALEFGSADVVVDLASVGSSGGGDIAYTLQADDSGALFVYSGNDNPVITVPATLGAGFQAAFALRPPEDGVVTVTPSGSWNASSPVGPTTMSMGADADGPVAFTLTIQAVSASVLLHIVGSGSKSYLARVYYSAGWPVERPIAEIVDAIGGTTAPTWLASTDLWFEDVS